MVARSLHYVPSEHLEDLAYLAAHLQVDPRAVELVSGVEASSLGLKAQSEDWNAKHHAVESTQTGLENADEVLNNAVRTAHSVILDDVQHNRRSPKFVIFFPRGMGAIIHSSYADQLTAVRTIASRCSQDPSPKIQEQSNLLSAAAKGLEAALAQRAEALVAESASYGELQVQKLQAIDTGRRVGYRLAEIYPDQRERVRSFFRPVHHRSRTAQPAAGESTPTQAPATAT